MIAKHPVWPSSQHDNGRKPHPHHQADHRPERAVGCVVIGDIAEIYPYALRTRKSAGLITRKLSVTESQKTAQFFGTSSRRKCRTDWQKSL